MISPNKKLHIQLLKMGLLAGSLALIGFGLRLTLADQTLAATGINKQLNYQAKLADANGVQVADNTYYIKFVIYDSLTGGNCLWTAAGACNSSDFGTTTVTTVNGVFSSVLGGTGHNSLATSSINWNSDSLYLGVTVRGTAASPVYDDEMSPRKRITASAYAFNTDTVDGLHATSTAAIANYLISLSSTSATLNLYGEGVSSTYATSTWLYISSNATTSNALWVGPNGEANNLDLSGGDLYVRDDFEVDGTAYFATSTFTAIPSKPHAFMAWSQGAANSYANDATVYINPASAATDTNLFGLAVGGLVQFLIDAEGDIFANTLTLSGSQSVGTSNVSTLIVENNSFLGDANNSDWTHIQGSAWIDSNKDGGNASSTALVITQQGSANYLEVSDGTPYYAGTRFFTITNSGVASSTQLFISNAATSTNYLMVTDGSPSVDFLNYSGGDLYVEDDLEVDGELYVGGSPVSGASQGWQSTTTDTLGNALAGNRPFITPTTTASIYAPKDLFVAGAATTTNYLMVTDGSPVVNNLNYVNDLYVEDSIEFDGQLFGPLARLTVLNATSTLMDAATVTDTLYLGGFIQFTEAADNYLYFDNDTANYLAWNNTSDYFNFSNDLYVTGHTTTTGNLEVSGYASTTNLVLADGASNLGTYNDLYVSSGNLYFNAAQITAASGLVEGRGAWEKYYSLSSPASIITPTTTNASIFISGHATTTGNLTVSGYASTTNLVLGNDGTNLGTYSDIYVSGGNLFFDTTQLTGGGGLSFWQYNAGLEGAISPTSTKGIYVTASSTIAANFRVDGTLKVTGNSTTTGNFTVGTSTLVVLHDPVGTGVNKVGIGTLTPGAALDVNGDGLANDIWRSWNTNTSFGALEFREGTTLQGYIQGVGSNFATAARRNDIEIDTSNGGDIVLGVANASVGIGDTSPLSLFTVGSGDKFRVDASGNATSSGWFNIGTTDVIATLGGLIGAGDLYVGSDATVTNSLIVSNGPVGIGTASPARELVIADTATGASVFSQWVNDGTGVTALDGLIVGLGADEATYLWNYENTDLYIGTNNITRIFVDNNGNVGINLTSPTSSLSVLGDLAVQDSSPDILLTAKTTTETTVGAKNNRLLLVADSSTVNNGGEIVWVASADSTTERWAAIGGDIQANNASGATGDIYIATKAAVGDTSLTKQLSVEDGGNVNVLTGDLTVTAGDIQIQTIGQAIRMKRNTSAAMVDVMRIETGTDSLSIFGGAANDNQFISFKNSGGIDMMTISLAGGFASTTGYLKVGSTFGGSGAVLKSGDLWVGNNATITDKIYVGGHVGVATNPSDTYALALKNENSTQTGYGIAFSWPTYSDARIKTDQRPIDYGLEEILKLQPKRYVQHTAEYIDGEMVLGDGSENIGLIAQEVFGIIPEAVAKPKSEADLWGLSYDTLVPVLIKAIQELSAKVDQAPAYQTYPENSVTVEQSYFDSGTTIVVKEAATFYGTINIIGEANFYHRVVFRKPVAFKDHISVSQDTAGTAVILANATEVLVTFKKPYRAVPVVSITANGNPESKYWAENKTPQGFKIVVNQARDYDRFFDWIALGTADETDSEADNFSLAPTINEFITSRSSVSPGNTVELWAKVTDPDNAEEELTYTWDFSPNAGSLTGNTGLVYWTVNDGELSQDTDVQITVTVSDGFNLASATKTVKVVVGNPAAPTGPTAAPVLGCTDETASNYNSQATQDDDSCQYQQEVVENPPTTEPVVVLGCTDSTALNYNAGATADDSSCQYQVTVQEEPAPEPEIIVEESPAPAPEPPVATEAGEQTPALETVEASAAE